AVAVAFGAVTARLFGLPPYAASAAPSEAPAGNMMGGMMSGHGMDQMMKPDNMMGGMMSGHGMDQRMKPDNMMGPMSTGMEGFGRHAKIHRSVTELPNGVRAVTESDDPETAGLIQAHVSEMYQRLGQNSAFPYPMSRSVPAMFAQSTHYQRKLEATPKGVVV